MTDFHENWEALPEDVRDMHRALSSLKEEIEAVDWYHQRQALCSDEQLRQILCHNRDEEIEHACMALEWLRRNVPAWDEQLHTYLFTTDPVTAVEQGAMGDGASGGVGASPSPAGGGHGLGIGNIE